MLVLRPSRIPLDPSREHGGGLGRSPESSPSLLLLWALLGMDGKIGLRAKGFTHYIAPELFLSPHRVQGLPPSDQVSTMKSKVAQLTILPSTKPGAKGNMGNLFKTQILFSCRSDAC